MKLKLVVLSAAFIGLLSSCGGSEKAAETAAVDTMAAQETVVEEVAPAVDTTAVVADSVAVEEAAAAEGH